ncbi:hypothetical protein ABZV34_35965, partial [Streptomyces sp. NPDC005195]|uniref:hypothetical protein n=1 Tax=Streptomyces sp. NPDC005195 TaxID=3154561 RepID=UPI0033BE5A2D
MGALTCARRRAGGQEEVDETVEGGGRARRVDGGDDGEADAYVVHADIGADGTGGTGAIDGLTPCSRPLAAVGGRRSAVGGRR